MKIGDESVQEILVLNSENEVLISISDENIIEREDCKVVFVPVKN